MTELFEAARFDEVPIFAWLVFGLSCIGFVIYYVRRYRTAGALPIDVWFVFYFILLQSFLTIPFAYSVPTELLLGANYTAYLNSIENVIWICCIGTAAFFVGAKFGRKAKRAPLGLVIVERCVRGYLLKSTAAWFIPGILLTGILIAWLLSNGVTFGQGRTAAFGAPSIQIANNLLNAIAQLLVIVGVMHWYKVRKQLALVGAVTMIAISLFGGTRTASVWPLLLCSAAIAHAKHYKRLLPVALWFVALVWVTLLYGAFRQGEPSAPVETVIGSELIFGGHITEQRDFSWVFSGWDGNYLWGKSFAAGALGFIPSSLSSFRQEWSWGKVTAQLIGLDPEVFPGFRLPIFGEPFFNFSYCGTISIGFLFAYLVFATSARVDAILRLAKTYSDAKVARSSVINTVTAAVIYLNLVQLFAVSVTFFVAYTQIGLLVLALVLIPRRPKRRIRREIDPTALYPIS